MKSKGIWLLLLLVLFSLTACNLFGGNTEPATEPATETADSETEETNQSETTEPETEAVTDPATEPAADELHAADFFYEQGDWAQYFSGNIPSSTDTMVTAQYFDGNRMQIAVCGDSFYCELQVWEVKEDSVVQTIAAQEQWFRQNLLTRNADQYENLLDEPIVYLKDPIAVGNTWTSGTLTMEIVDVVPKTAEHGARVVVDQRIEGGDGGRVYTLEENRWAIRHEDYTAEDVAISELQRHETKPVDYPVYLYYPGTADTFADNYIRMVVWEPFPVNSITREVLAKVYKDNTPSDGLAVLKPEDTINSLYLNEDGQVYVDLSKSFASMNAGASGETQILKSMAFTAASLMNGTDGVILTLDDQPYEGGHVALQAGETLPVLPGEQDIVTEVE